MVEYDNDRWVIRATNRRGTRGWYGEGWQRRPGVMTTRGDAYRYADELAARAAGYHARDVERIIVEFTVEKLPERPRFKKTPDGREGNT